MIIAALLLAAGTAELPVEKKETLSLEDRKVRCVREQVTGSIARTRKVCHTAREWRSIWANARQEIDRIMQPGTLNDLNLDPPEPSGG